MIVGFSGKKKSGKTSCAKWLVGAHLKYINAVAGAGVNDAGDLIVEYLKDGQAVSEILDLVKPHPLLDTVRPFVSVFPLATELKRISCEMFGLSPDLVYGVDDQKNQKSNIKWADLKWVLTKKEQEVLEKQVAIDGYVTVRGFLQIFGTNICRRILPSCHSQNILAKIKVVNSDLSLIPDVRFPDELDVIHEEGGKMIRLTRGDATDNHNSETLMDQLDPSKYDKIIENGDPFSMSDLCKNLYFAMKDFGALPFTMSS